MMEKCMKILDMKNIAEMWFASKEDLEKSKAQGVTVAYFGGENKKYETFLKAAEKFDDIRFVHSFSSELKE